MLNIRVCVCVCVCEVLAEIRSNSFEFSSYHHHLERIHFLFCVVSGDIDVRHKVREIYDFIKSSFIITHTLIYREIVVLLYM